jgi:hypothetical protein
MEEQLTETDFSGIHAEPFEIQHHHAQHQQGVLRHPALVRREPRAGLHRYASPVETPLLRLRSRGILKLHDLAAGQIERKLIAS